MVSAWPVPDATVLFEFGTAQTVQKNMCFAATPAVFLCCGFAPMVRNWCQWMTWARGIVGRLRSRGFCLRPWPYRRILAGCSVFSADLKQLFAYDLQSGLPGTICRADGENRIPVPPPKHNVIHQFAFQPGGTGFACGSGYGHVEHWPSTSDPPVIVADLGMYVSKVQYSEDGRYLLSMSHRWLSIWDTVAKKEIYRQESGGEVAALSPDGKRMIQIHHQKYRVTNLSTGQTVEWQGERSIGTVAFTPDSASILVGQITWNAFRYDLTADGNPVGEPLKFAGHSSAIRSFAQTADGRRLAAGAEDGTVKIWDTETGQEVLGLNSLNRVPITALLFSPEGRLIATPERGIPFVFDGSPRLPIQKAKVK
jgi:WD40 repeat protein